MCYEVSSETVKVLSPLYCGCGKPLNKHAVILRGEFVEVICAYCQKTLLEFKVDCEKNLLEFNIEGSGEKDSPYAGHFEDALTHSKLLADCLEDALDRTLVFSKAEEVLRRFYAQLNTWECL